MTDLNTFELARLDEQLQAEAKAFGLLTRDKLVRRLMSLGLRQQVELAEALRVRKLSSESAIARKRDYNTTGEKEEKRRPLEKTVRSKVYTKQGWIDAVGQSFARKGIFLERGVGRGRPVNSPKANAAKKEWIKPVLDPAVEELATLLSEKYADLAVQSLRILIPGIIDTKIRG